MAGRTEGSALQVDEVVEQIRPDRLFVLAFLDDRGEPAVSAVTWVRGRPPDRVDVVVGRRARLLRSLAVHPAVALVMFAPSVLAVAGEARVVEPRVPGVPIPLARVEIRVEGVRDVMFTGGVLEAGPRVAKTYPPRLAGLDRTVARYLDDVGTHPGVGGP
jgi:hypothetical protein